MVYHQEQYYLYSLPKDLLNGLTPRNLINNAVPSRSPSPKPDTFAADTILDGKFGCNICPEAIFSDVNEQRLHFRSDWHRFNVKMRLNGGTTVPESGFAQLVDEIQDSLSGSETSDESDVDSSDDAVTTLVKKNKIARSDPQDDINVQNAPRTAIMWFHSPPSTQIGVYRTIFSSPRADPLSHLSALKDMQAPSPHGRIWAMFMVAGGHFAGAIVRVSYPESDDTVEDIPKKGKQKRPRPDTEVLKHKTFHRYTTRRKQGGSQSLNDNAKGNAKSAGALLRRYGEQALKDVDIRNLLREWADEINDCERIWIRASGSNRKIFIDYDECVIEKGDERLRTFPFPTRRPTQSELARCLQELTRVKISHLTEETLQAQDEAYLASLPKPKPVPVQRLPTPAPEKAKAPKLTPEEEVFRDKWSRVIDMVNKGRLEPLKILWDRESAGLGGIDAFTPTWADEKQYTLLQIAAQAGQENITEWLLESARADPTVEVSLTAGDDSSAVDADDSRGNPKGSVRTAYDLARTRGVRDIFRRCAAAHPDWWDWFGAAHVPSGLSKEMEEEREEKKKERRKGLKDKIREREAKEREKEKERPAPPPEPPAPARKNTSQDATGPRRLGGSAGAQDGVAGLTPELRAKVERERRARAAEARLRL
ncbi:hypothetical protein FISHEDRAFT_69388 [Fistulina hepatica ATCC 64428]|uniref:VLRF1 domain-containing protein n=1 Tax=Fistulina hepatica ATCC 64428 TaxID=1128425 RepID=A0A0D7ANN8_9AGAR|nr:hypothetical protein FISHEDRAFT_69388 [Fistulina hepatica ATCC 64428]